MAAAAAGGDDDAGFKVFLNLAMGRSFRVGHAVPALASAFQEREYQEAARRSEEAMVCAWMIRKQRRISSAHWCPSWIAAQLQVVCKSSGCSVPSRSKPKPWRSSAAKERRRRRHHRTKQCWL